MIADAPPAGSSSSHNGAARRPRYAARQPLCALVVLLGLAACGEERTAPAAPPPPSPTDQQAAHVPLSPTCTDGTVESCTVKLGEHDGIVSCYEGTRTCVGGAFGACTDGQGFEIERPEATSSSEPGLRPMAFGQPADCTNNPCNRYCREFYEVPPEGLVADVDGNAPPLSSWLTGDASDYAPEWAVLGNREPCQVASDCQMNTYCGDPAPGSCTHSVCTEGEPLAAGCNRCADAVCAENPSCCGPTPSCAHDPCEVGNGAPLDAQCDTCVAAVCEKYPECCTDPSALPGSHSWNELCVGYIATECASLGQSCECPADAVDTGAACLEVGRDDRDWFFARDACSERGAGWTLAALTDATENEAARGAVERAGLAGAWLDAVEVAVDQWNWMSVGEPFFFSDASGGSFAPGYDFAPWGVGEPELGVAGRGITLGPDGSWRDATLDFGQGYVCEGPKNRLGPKQSPLWWGPECVELAPSVCGVACSDGLGIGACAARVPTELDPACAGFDLSLGVTCDDAGSAQVPVCNHGQTTAPAGLRLTHVPIGELRRAAPDLSSAVDCAVTEAIPPGRCVTVSGCPSLDEGRALIVNPPDGAQNTSECRTDDNWTIYQPIACSPAVCESRVMTATQVRNRACTIDLEHPLGVDAAQARVTVGTGVPEPTCGANEVRWGSSCYFFSNDLATWDDARNRCRGRGTGGWDLVALNSEAENAWVRSLAESGRSVQIGLTDGELEGTYQWTNGSCRSFDNWEPSQPDNLLAGSEQCSRLTPSGTWEDTACGDGAHPYVCEGPVIDARGGCAAGQISGPDGNCYRFDAAARSHSDASASCAAIDPGWQLAYIDDQTTNDFVTSLVGCTPTWLNNPPGSSFSRWAPSEAVDLSQDPYMDELGFWRATDDGTPRATLCQGPATATGAPVLTQVADDVACSGDDQYYFTGNGTAPESLHLCPAACDAAAAVSGRLIELEIPCLPPPQPAIVTYHSVLYGEESVTGGNACPGSTPQWDFLYYDAVTPADSRVELFVRTASTSDELADDVTLPILVADAHALPTDTRRCETVNATCPIDLFGALGEADQLQRTPLLELIVRLVPGSNGEGPMLRDWTVRFSCPPSQ